MIVDIDTYSQLLPETKAQFFDECDQYIALGIGEYTLSTCTSLNVRELDADGGYALDIKEIIQRHFDDDTSTINEISIFRDEIEAKDGTITVDDVYSCYGENEVIQTMQPADLLSREVAEYQDNEDAALKQRIKLMKPSLWYKPTRVDEMNFEVVSNPELVQYIALLRTIRAKYEAASK